MSISFTQKEVHLMNISNYQKGKIQNNINIKIEEKLSIQDSNFLKAYNFMKQKNKNTLINNSEYSETNVISSKEENINYLNNPITKNIIKKGNSILKIEKKESKIINKPNKIHSNLISNITENEEEEDDIYKKTNNTNCNIDDLDEDKELNINQYKNKEKNSKDKQNNEISKKEIGSFYLNNTFNNNNNDIISRFDDINITNSKEKVYIIDSIFLDNTQLKDLSNEKEIYLDDLNEKMNFEKAKESTIKIINLSDCKSINSKYSTSKTISKRKLFKINNNLKYHPKRNSKNEFDAVKKFCKKSQINDSLKINSFHQNNLSKISISSIGSIISNTLFISSKINKNELEEHSTIFDLDFLNNLIEKDKIYQKEINPNYLEQYSNISFIDRAKMFSLISILCEQFAYKRDTFYFSIYSIDRYLSKQKNKNLTKNELLIITITSLALSAKIEEIQIPNIKDYLNCITSINNNEDYKHISIKEIILMEQKFMLEFNWRNNPNTINTWMNWHICQWDLFINSIDNNYSLLCQEYGEGNIIYFKNKDNESYYNYRIISQFIDFIILNIDCLKFNSQYLIFGCILEILKNKYKDFENKNIYLDIFNRFVNESLGDNIFEEKEFIDCLKFCDNILSYFFSLNLINYDIPLVYQSDFKNIENGTYEDFLTYHIYNENIYSSFVEYKKNI
jgi:hypothetical protein